MADQPKRKNPSNITRNTDRKNGKRSKSSPNDVFAGRKAYRGSHTKGVRLTELDKALMGGGAMDRIKRPAPGNEPRKAS